MQIKSIYLIGVITLFSVGVHAEDKGSYSLGEQHQKSMEHLKKMKRIEHYNRVFDDPTLGGSALGKEDY